MLSATPPSIRDDLEIITPEYSHVHGEKPHIVKCAREYHVDIVIKLVKERLGQLGCKIAIVSETKSLLHKIRLSATREQILYTDVFQIDDLVVENAHHRTVLDLPASCCFIGRLESVKGYEFDTVIACNISKGIVPANSIPTDEYWRQAAVLYSAFTRARENLIITFENSPSEFLELMKGDVVFQTELSDSL